MREPASSAKRVGLWSHLVAAFRAQADREVNVDSPIHNLEQALHERCERGGDHAGVISTGGRLTGHYTPPCSVRRELLTQHRCGLPSDFRHGILKTRAPAIRQPGVASIA
jgi:hypothetical protein